MAVCDVETRRITATLHLLPVPPGVTFWPGLCTRVLLGIAVCLFLQGCQRRASETSSVGVDERDRKSLSVARGAGTRETNRDRRLVSATGMKIGEEQGYEEMVDTQEGQRGSHVGEMDVVVVVNEEERRA